MSSRRNPSRRRPAIEPLEARCLLSASVISEIPLGTNADMPNSLTHDSAGNVWYVKPVSNVMGMVDAATGAVTEYSVSPWLVFPSSITFGADNNLWVTEADAHFVDKFDTSGNLLAQYSTGDSMPISITAGPDGNLWFTEVTGYGYADNGEVSYYTAVAKLTTDGTMTEYPLHVTSANVGTIIAGSDGALWFTYIGVDQQTYSIDNDTGEMVYDTPYRTNSGIGRITTDGFQTAFGIPHPENVINSLTVDANGTFWYTAYDSRVVSSAVVTDTRDVIGSFTFHEGQVYLSATEYDVPLDGADFVIPSGIAAGADGNIWFGEALASKVARFNPSTGVFDTFDTPTAAAGPGQMLALGNKIYFTEENVGQIGIVDLSAFDTQTPENLVTTSRSVTVGAGATFSGVVAGFDTALDQAAALGLNVTIDWGDGNTSAGVITASDSGYVISGENAYATPGSYAITVTVSGEAINTATIVSAATVTDPFAAQGTSFVGTENSTIAAAVANFVGPDGTYTALINWGDGTSSAGVVTGSSGSYSVLGGHTYATQGSYDVTVSISDGTTTKVVHTLGSVSDTPLMTYGVAISPLLGRIVLAQTAYFTDDVTANFLQYRASINWGDGKTSAGLVLPTTTAGQFVVIGAHSYAKRGRYTVTTTITYLGSDTENASSNYVGVSIATI